MNDSVPTRVRYSTLDRAENDVRIRLNSTVVNAHHVGDRAKANAVEVTYVQDGQAHRVRAGTCVMACYNSVIPYLCPELPEDQKEHLHMAVRRPFVAANVMIRDWRAFERLGVARIRCPGEYFESVSLDDWSNSFGDYQTGQSPDDPVALRLWASPIAPGLPVRDQWRAAREELLGMSFETFERASGISSLVPWGREASIPPGHRGHLRQPLAPRVRGSEQRPLRPRLGVRRGSLGIGS